MELEFIAHPQGAKRLGDFLRQGLRSKEWLHFRASVAFVKRSGTKHIRDALAAFSERGGKVTFSAGVDAGGTSAEGLLDLINAVGDRGDILVFKNANASTFHPKVYLFKNATHATVLVGSGNLTEGGLFTNYEASILLKLDLADPVHVALLTEIEKTLDDWSTPAEGLCYRADAALVQKLVHEGHVPDEAHTKTIDDKTTVGLAQVADAGSPIFKWFPVPAAPKLSVQATTPTAGGLGAAISSALPAQAATHTAFVMTLQRTDVGVGQTTAGTQRRSPEIFIPLIARDFDPEFWGWPDKFVADPGWKGPFDGNGRGKMDRTNVIVRLGGDQFPVVLWYNPQKRDLRIRSEHVRSAGSIGDILYVERSNGTQGFSYYVDVIPQSSAKFAQHYALCTEAVRNSAKRWGYV